MLFSKQITMNGNVQILIVVELSQNIHVRNCHETSFYNFRFCYQSITSCPNIADARYAQKTVRFNHTYGSAKK